MSSAEKLKEEGNKLFVKKKFAAAAIKYTEAIALDGQNAVLYANRSACRLSLKQFLDAKDDAKQATKLDPEYAKGWTRLASAHDVWLLNYGFAFYGLTGSQRIFVKHHCLGEGSWNLSEGEFKPFAAETAARVQGCSGSFEEIL